MINEKKPVSENESACCGMRLALKKHERKNIAYFRIFFSFFYFSTFQGKRKMREFPLITNLQSGLN